MKFHILIGQRVVNYPGQYAPEVIMAMSEGEWSDNGLYMRDVRSTHLKGGKFTAVEIVTLEADTKEIVSRLSPSSESIKAAIVAK